MTVRIVLVRHGESTFNIEKRIQGRSDLSRLTERGYQQATCVQKALEGITFTQAYSSPLERARATAQTILAHQTVSLDTTPQLQEIHLPDWSGMTFAEVRDQQPEAYHLWRHHPDELAMAGTYPVRDLWEQAKGLWASLRSAYSQPPEESVTTILLVGHSGINRALISTALGIPPQHYHRLGQDNCAISVLNFPQGLEHPPQLESLNLTAHLGDALPKSKGGLRLLLVRHGETQWNRDQRFQGQMDIPLNETGVAQAQQVAAFLGSQPIDVAFSSPLKRSWETAAAICHYTGPDGTPAHPHLQLTAVPGLQEISHGLWEGKLQADIKADFPGQLELWQTSPEQVQMPEGENLGQVWERTRSAWADIVAKTQANGSDTLALVSAHDAINKAAICQVFDLNPQAFWCFKQGNGAVTVIDYPDGPSGYPVLRTSNSTAHMEGGVLDRTAAGAL